MQQYYKSINFNAIGFLTLLILTTLFIVQKTIFSKAVPTPTSKIKFTGEIIEHKDLSAIGLIGKYILIGADEGNTIQVLEPKKSQAKYQVSRNIELPIAKSSKAEIDVEGIAVSDNNIYVVGSHSSNNKTKSQDQNNRKSVFHFKLNSDTGKLESSIEKASLQKILEPKEILLCLKSKSKKSGGDLDQFCDLSLLKSFGQNTPE